MASRRRRTLGGLSLAIAIVVVTVGLVTGVLPQAGRSALYATGLWNDGGAPSLDPRVGASAGRPEADVPAVLEPAPSGPVPEAAALARRIKAVEPKDVGGWVSAYAVDGAGDAVYDSGGARAAMPASTLKILTTASALSLLGPERRFVTRVSDAGEAGIVLVGGGDPLLCSRSCAPQSASLPALAERTAAQLKAQGRTTVRLAFDASLFTGPAWNPRWPETYRDQVTPISALWVDEGRIAGVSPGPRETDPAGTATKAFAALLERRGIEVSLAPATRAAPQAAVLASVESAPLAEIAEHVLMHSDNDAAEVLLRHIGIAASGVGSTEAGAKGAAAAVDKLVGPSTLKMFDGSGLSRDNRVPAEDLVKVVRLALDASRPELRSAATGLPVAGVTGSLAGRFAETGSGPGRGMVRAKTGTLRKTHSLAGFVQTRDGSVVAFAFLVNDADNDYAARVWLDRVSAAVAGCGCS